MANSAMPDCSRKAKVPDHIIIEDYIIIEDDDGHSEVENKSSHDGARVHSSHSRAQHDCKKYKRARSQPSIVSSDEEDCVVIEPSYSRKPSFSNRRGSDAKRMPEGFAQDGCDPKQTGGGLSDSSDSDIIVDYDGTVKRCWEEAALRKRIGGRFSNSSYKAESEESESISKNSNTDRRQDSKTRQSKRSHQFKNFGHSADQFSTAGVPPPGVGSTDWKEGKHLHAGFDHESNLDVLDARSGDANDQPVAQRVPSAGVTTHGTEGNSVASRVPPAGVTAHGICEILEQHDWSLPVSSETQIAETEPMVASHDVDLFANGLETEAISMEDPQQREAAVGALGSSHDSHTGNLPDAEADPILVREVDIVIGRERLKESEEFKHAVAGEWARRQEELKKQAREAMRERKKRRREAEMVIRQRQRLEEVRQTDKKKSQILDFKERVRDQKRTKLEHMAAPCRDMATLLRRLEIQVDGGSFPTTEQVNAAYKRALLRFHPDRVAARDTLHQVEAEETFKLISRLKSILPPVAPN